MSTWDRPKTPSDEIRWRRIDSSDWLAHGPDYNQFPLIYGRIYTSRRGYEYSATNQFIANLKMSPGERSERLKYKQRAIERFASEVTDFFRRYLDPDRQVTLVPMPPSKIRSHPDYDDRLEQVAQRVASFCDQVTWLPLLKGIRNMESYHLSTQFRDPDEIFEAIAIDGSLISQYQKGSVLFILDDILTSGAHFTAAVRHIEAVLPDAVIAGIFWAKAQALRD